MRSTISLYLYHQSSDPLWRCYISRCGYIHDLLYARSIDASSRHSWVTCLVAHCSARLGWRESLWSISVGWFRRGPRTGPCLNDSGGDAICTTESYRTRRAMTALSVRQ